MAFFKRVDLQLQEGLPVKYSELAPHERRVVRHAYIMLQDSRCYYCKAPLLDVPADYVRQKSVNKALFPEGFFDHPVHLHHDHTTDMTIGAVHAWCNAVLWEYDGE